LYAEEEDGGHPMKDFSLPLTTTKEMPWESKHHPILTFRFVFLFVIRVSPRIYVFTAARNISHTMPSVNSSGVNT
jgi:hypothetical protein